LQAEKARLAREQQAVRDKYRLTVLATPADSQIKIMNIVPKYVPGIALKPGKYDVLVQKPGYMTSRQWITIQDQDISLPVVLEKFAKIFRDRLKDGSQGPEMVRIQGGSFRMGDIQGGGDSDEKPVHSVSVARFAMGRYEVTVGEFRQFVNATGYKTDAEKQGSCWTYAGSWKKVKGANWRKPKFSQTNTHPVVCVSWNDATAYAKWLSQQTGHTYRLPTEAQWEYAARAGTTTSRYWGNDPNEACRYANVHDNTSKQKNNGFTWTHHKCTDGYAQTAPVGRFKANAFDLFDMLGNVWEWTCSEYEDKYTGKESKCIRQNSGSRRALRGGAWGYKPWSVRAAGRYWESHDGRYLIVGLRLARLL
jgi:formylglycine-generating enzyme required for sulfatase activity